MPRPSCFCCKSPNRLLYFEAELVDRKFSYIDLFAGCGGLSLGLFKAGWSGLFAIEKSEDAFKTLKYNLIDNKKHFSWVPWLEQTHHDIDIVMAEHETNLKSLQGSVDLVTGGPPCQGFSMVGRREELDERNELVNSYVEFIRLVKPKLIFFENVKGFTLEFRKNKEKGRDYSKYVSNQLDKAGYYVRGNLINFANYGVPQKRTRFILIGVQKKFARYRKAKTEEFFSYIESNREEFLINKGLPTTPTLGDAISDLLMSHGKVACPDFGGYESGLYSHTDNPYQIYMRADYEDKIANSHRFAKHKLGTAARMEYILKHSRRNRDIDKSIRDKYKITKHRLIALDENEQCPTLTSHPDDSIHYSEARILTVRECARIQSFPDWYEFKGKYTTGGDRRKREVPRYTQVGNAVPPLFGEFSGLALKTLLT